MKSARVITCAAIILLVLSGPHQLGAASKHSRKSTPAICAAASAEVRFRVMSALDLAVRRVKRVPACGALFENLGRNGTATLARGTFELARSAEDGRVCGQRSAAAFTTVGGTRTSLCPATFLRLNRTEAALILLHEALHQAGLSEQPHDPTAPTSMEISRMVRAACRM